VLVGFPLTGAALNPARWLGPVLWESMSRGPVLLESMSRPDSGPNPWADFLVYLSGPTIGALLAGWFWARIMPAPTPGKK
jgi:glycerol uptake facilitator-like aquaporin